jgi:hypothetical protein
MLFVYLHCEVPRRTIINIIVIMDSKNWGKAGGVTQEVEHLPSKYTALSSKIQTTALPKKKKKKLGWILLHFVFFYFFHHRDVQSCVAEKQDII